MYRMIEGKPVDAEIEKIGLRAPIWKLPDKANIGELIGGSNLYIKNIKKSDFPALLQKVKSATNIYLGKPEAYPEISAVSGRLLVYPGSIDEAILDIVFGNLSHQNNFV